MSDFANAVAAGGTISHAGHSYQMAPLSNADWGEIKVWVEGWPLEVAKRHLDGLDPEDRQLLIDRALIQCKEYGKALSLGDGSDPDKVQQVLTEMRSALESVQGVAYLLWLSLRKAHPGLTRQQAASMVSEETLAEFSHLLDRVNGLPADLAGDPKNR